MPGEPATGAASGVTAVVLTYDAPDALAACLAALTAQTEPPASVLVVDNASEPPAVVPDGGCAEVLRLRENLGPAGGYAAGLRAFLASGAGHVWLVDDDSTPRPDALAAQRRAAAAADRPTAFLARLVDRDTGEVADTHGWCGVLLPREIVAAVGVPMEDLFWWSEDTEYLQWRIPRAGFGLERCPDAVVEVGRRRANAAKPAWKYYYETRNQVYFRLHIQRQPDDGPPAHHLTRRVRWWRAGRAVLRLAARAVLREPDGRVAKLRMVARGARDGAGGRLGRTVAVSTADRPPPPVGSGGVAEPEVLLQRDQP
jgi:hypothetical protein